MPNHFVIFVHGVGVRIPNPDKPDYADALYQKILNRLNELPTLHKIPFYWGDINDPAENQVLQTLTSSSIWSECWFKHIRATQILDFVGDAALYISSTIGSQVVQRLYDQVFARLQPTSDDDRLHLVSSSWGTVILFDVLFSERWDRVPNNQAAQLIRDIVYGVGQNPGQSEKGICVGSIHTMGSPVAFFNLMGTTGTDLAKTTSHGIANNLSQFLTALKDRLKDRLPWRNFIHPGDALGYPLEVLIPFLVNDQRHKLIQIDDVLIEDAGPRGFIPKLADRLPWVNIANMALGAGSAHVCYWHSDTVAAEIAEVIRSGPSKPLA